jgi:pSer/pThr/pTyr-binding forkhead associated (FHA) protein
MKLYLIVAKGKQQGTPIRVDSQLFMMGSSNMCQLRSKLQGIGAEHCVVTHRERKVFLRDLGSGETTLVNGEVLPPDNEWPLHTGDRIEVGPLEFLVQFTEKDLSQRDMEEWALRCLDANDDQKRDIVEDLEMMARKEKALNAAKAAEAILDRLTAQRGLVKGRLRIGLEMGVTVVRINDSFLVEEAELALIEKELRENLTRPSLRVLLDFKNVRRCSTKAVQIVGELATWLESWGSTFAVCRIRDDLKATLLSLPALQGIRVFPDKPSALAAHW